MIFLTKIITLMEGYPCLRAGPEIEADSFEEAEEVAERRGVLITGRLRSEINEHDTVGQIISKMRFDYASEDTISAVIDEVRGR